MYKLSIAAPFPDSTHIWLLRAWGIYCSLPVWFGELKGARLRDSTVGYSDYDFRKKMKNKSIQRKGHLDKTRKQLDKTKNSIVCRKTLCLRCIFSWKLNSLIFCSVISMQNILTWTCVPQRRIPNHFLQRNQTIFRCHAKRILANLRLMHVCPIRCSFLVYTYKLNANALYMKCVHMYYSCYYYTMAGPKASFVSQIEYSGHGPIN